MGDGDRPNDRLMVRTLPRGATAAVLLLHGGREQGLGKPTRLNAPAWRMRPFVRVIGEATGERSVAIAEARYRHRGWNGDRADAARDAIEAVTELARLTDGAPVVLVGHSMGGRAALRAAGDPAVTGVSGVVALAPWCPPGEPVAGLAGTRLVFVHARGDRITSPDKSLRMAVEAREAGAEVCRYELPDGDHAMLRKASLWHRLTARTVAALLGVAPLPAEVASAFALPPGSTDGLALPAESGVPLVRG
ncbi:dienelactone hydrolase family protein [Streptomyces sp. NBC_01190]|uniref:dienelactone hydrolase family protein n=1 Tax=Streptomyces sp. NBC_01190 TaxID=2903767 RepID=UPI00386D7BC6|nr:alpha/beta fold hydrolase [Streptomyces sp. NBC_01190]